VSRRHTRDSTEMMLRWIPGADRRVKPDYEAGLIDKYFVMVCTQAPWC